MVQLVDAPPRDHPVTRPGDPPAARFGYAGVSDPEASFAAPPAAGAIRSELDRARDGGETDLAALAELAAAWSATERERYRALAGEPASADLLARRAALGCAPLGLVSGAWLQWLSAPGNAHEGTVLAILALYASDLGVGHPRASRGSAYLELLRRLRVADYASPASNVVHDRRVPDEAFHLPYVLLAMGRRPDDFLPELLGADLCLRAVGTLPPLAVVQAGGVHADWAALDPGAERPGAAPGGAPGARAAVDSLLASGFPDAEERLATGFRWARLALGEWSDSLGLDLSGALDPAREMAELLRQRAREGAVYHQGYELAGRPLSTWLAEARTDPGPLLAALASSELVRPGCSAASRLVALLVNERGRMYRVFAPEDLAVIRRWIDALPAAGERAHHAPVRPAAERPVPTVAPSPGTANGSDERPRSIREAYHRLQSRSGSPALRDWAEGYVRGWLARARSGVADGNDTQLPATWSPEGLRPWLLDQHDRHAEGFEADMKTPLPSREALVDSTVQLAPLTLIDGSWLQGFTDYEHGSSEVGRFLFETYWDELGNGLPRLNHPRIYRELLDEMGVHLPPTRAREFAESPLLKDRSFELPVYWLSIGHFPRTFLPEVLGLNVAMELSGVGGSYRRARISLKHHGFSTRFVDIHNTIDNVAAGHSAWAADAVDTYMASVGDTQGREAQAAAWERIRVGFVSLNPPDGRRARRTQRRTHKAALTHGGRR